ncbi:MAG: M48 family metallopeptidase [Gammaproteobacteria bacterium]|nr:M48 family metallopeptidase [Gammaproteobacteria bacterium]
MLIRRSALALTIAATLLLNGCATSPTGRSQLMLVSPEMAIDASREAYVETLSPLEKEGKIDSTPATSKRVRDITGRIITQAIEQYPRTKDWEWSVKVIDEPETVNAWCMAGGKMAVYTGLLQKIDPSDDELAAVMGHEIAHAIANHTAEKMSVALATQIGMAGVAIAASDSRYSNLALTGASLAAVVAIQLPNSRTAESEADHIGLELAARAGYDPRASLSLWDKMGKVGGDNPPEFLSTHPAPASRQRELAKLIPTVMPYYREDRPRPIYILK